MLGWGLIARFRRARRRRIEAERRSGVGLVLYTPIYPGDVPMAYEVFAEPPPSLGVRPCVRARPPGAGCRVGRLTS